MGGVSVDVTLHIRHISLDTRAGALNVKIVSRIVALSMVMVRTGKGAGRVTTVTYPVKVILRILFPTTNRVLEEGLKSEELIN